MHQIDSERLDEIVRSSTETLCRLFVPAGKKNGREWKIADITGAKGNSLGIQLTGPKAGVWHDRATDQGGTFVELLMKNRSVTFPAAVELIEGALGISLRKAPEPFGNSQWQECVQRMTFLKRAKLCAYRNYSPPFVDWLVDQALIGIFKDRDGFERWVFPFHHEGKVAAIHCEIPGEGRKKWFYSPKLSDLGLKLAPFVLGDLASAKEVHIHESQWDLLAQADVIDFDVENQGIALVATLGAANGALAGVVNKLEAKIYLWPQRDIADENGKIPAQDWLRAVQKTLRRAAYVCRIPDLAPDRNFDFNDWCRSGKVCSDDLEQIMDRAELFEPPAPEKKTPRFAADLARDYGAASKDGEGPADGAEENYDIEDQFQDDERDEVPELDPSWEDPGDQCTDTKQEKEQRDTFPVDALPETIVVPVKDWMRHLRIPTLLPAICALVAISVALGRGIKALSNKAWTFPNIFAMIGAETGSGKSLVYDEAMRPLIELQIAMEEALEKENGRILAKIGMAKAEITAKHSIFQKGVREKKLTENDKQGILDSLSELHQQVEDLEDRLAKPPCVWTSDFTSEALGVCLKNNDERVAVISDEGSIAVYNILGRYNDGNITDDALLCKCFSVNSHGVDRLSRKRITLNHPCVPLLLIVQPDILRMAFSNTRLLIGGFLARCLSADAHLQMQEETEDSAIHFDDGIAGRWNQFIKDLFDKFHQAKEPYKLKVDPSVRAKSRLFYNKIVRLVKGRLSDVRGFAARWTEQAWKIAELLHVGKHRAECENHVLAGDTFENATRIVRYFIATQLEVLKMLRLDAVEKTYTKYGSCSNDMRTRLCNFGSWRDVTDLRKTWSFRA